MSATHQTVPNETGPREFGAMLWITDTFAIDEGTLDFAFIRARGPGGQNVNKVATAVQLRFDAAACAGLDPAARDRLDRLAGRRMTTAGVLVIEARRFRTQERNRRDAIDRLVALLRQAAIPAKPRRRRPPPHWLKARRLTDKRRRADTKRTRGPVGDADM